MEDLLGFDPKIFETILGGRSTLELSNLNIRTRDEGERFLIAYGFDPNDESDAARLWSFHRRAITYLQTQILNSGEVIPQELCEAVLIGEIWRLLAWASDSNPNNRNRQKWACAILRVMHVISHLSHDLFSAFSEEIQAQVMRPYQEMIFTESVGHVRLGRPEADDSISLEKFDIKPFKTSNSAITKLLAKPEEVAFGLLDRMGVRFVTRTVFDGFRVMAWLVRHNVISFPHLIPDQSTNSLYPLNLFFEVLQEVAVTRGDMQTDEIERLLQKKLDNFRGQAGYRVKPNAFTNQDYRFMKFIVRRLIRTKAEAFGRPFAFFYPYEIQIMDRATFVRNQTGPASHPEYKARQRARARTRILPDGLP
jgi:uncharacterized protein (TIGR04562 family)